MKKEFFTNLEKVMDEICDKTLEKWSKQVSEDEYENIETVLLGCKWDVLRKAEKIK